MRLQHFVDDRHVLLAELFAQREGVQFARAGGDRFCWYIFLNLSLGVHMTRECFPQHPQVDLDGRRVGLLVLLVLLVVRPRDRTRALAVLPFPFVLVFTVGLPHAAPRHRQAVHERPAVRQPIGSDPAPVVRLGSFPALAAEGTRLIIIGEALPDAVGVMSPETLRFRPRPLSTLPSRSSLSSSVIPPRASAASIVSSAFKAPMASDVITSSAVGHLRRRRRL